MRRKIFILLLILFVMIAGNTVFAAEGPGLYYDFYYEWDDSWSYVPESWVGTSCDLEYSDNALKMNMHNGDPNFVLELREFIELSEYPFIKVRVKNLSPTSDMLEMYIARDGEGLGEGNVFKFNIGKEHTEFKEFIINASNVKGSSWWTGEMTYLRFDGLNNPTSDGGDEFYIEYLAFFKTQEDAEAWTPDRNQTPPPTPSPTPEPTPSPVPTETKKPTDAPKSTPKKDAGESGSISTPVLITCGVIVVAAVAAAVVIIIKRRKA